MSVEIESIRRDDWETLKPTVHGWGINDVNYKVRLRKTIGYVNGKQKTVGIWFCPYYQDWAGMIMRCKSKASLKKNPSYKGVEICEEWRYFSNFIKWVKSQPNKNWENCHLDKDILSGENKRYSPETCVYVSVTINNFMLDSKGNRGETMLGVSPERRKGRKPFRARCKDPFTGKKHQIGAFWTEIEAHLTWKAKKHSYALILADTQDDPRVSNFLRNLYSPETDWTKR